MGNIFLIQWLAFERLSNAIRRPPVAIHPENTSSLGHAGLVWLRTPKKTISSIPSCQLADISIN
jgi:hypothetical protein